MELILSTFGTNLNTDNQAFVVARGYERQRVPVAEVSAIQINKGNCVNNSTTRLFFRHFHSAKHKMIYFSLSGDYTCFIDLNRYYACILWI